MPLAVKDEGTGFPVVFLHAFPLNSEMWEEAAAAVRDKGYRSIRFDLPGFGNSGGVMEDLQTVADDVRTGLEKLKVERAVVCGLSMGGYVAFELFRSDPDLFAAAILCDTTSEADTPEKRASRKAAVNQIEGSGTTSFMKELADAMVSPTTFNSKPATVDGILDSFHAASANAVCAALLAMARRRPSTSLLREFKWPVLLVFGTDDPMLLDGSMMESELRHGKLEVLENVGHFSSLEAPRRFNTLIIRFLESLDLD